MDLHINAPPSARAHHREFIANALPVFRSDPRIAGLAIAGSWANDSMDDHSDVDVVVGVEPSAFDEVMADRVLIASRLGNLVASFTGEHVGEPRVLICLYSAPLLHVDLKFVDIEQIGATVDRPAVLWQRGDLGEALMRSFTGYPKPDRTWIEDRFWTWIHYGATKVLRGELFEAIDLITLLRGRVLGPLVLESAGAIPTGVRRLESVAPDWTRRMEETVAGHSAGSCLHALAVCAEIYRELCPISGGATTEAEQVALTFLREAAGARR